MSWAGGENAGPHPSWSQHPVTIVAGICVYARAVVRSNPTIALGRLYILTPNIIVVSGILLDRHAFAFARHKPVDDVCNCQNKKKRTHFFTPSSLCRFEITIPF